MRTPWRRIQPQKGLPNPEGALRRVIHAVFQTDDACWFAIQVSSSGSWSCFSLVRRRLNHGNNPPSVFSAGDGYVVMRFRHHGSSLRA